MQKQDTSASRSPNRSRSPKISIPDPYEGIPEEALGYFCKDVNEEPSCNHDKLEQAATIQSLNQQGSQYNSSHNSDAFIRQMNYLTLMSPIRSAAQRACLESFGSSSSSFLNSCMVSFLLRGDDGTSSIKIKMMTDSLPPEVRFVAAESLRQICQQSGVRLMGSPSHIVNHAEDAIRCRLRFNSSIQFYIGISEQPSVRFEQHRCNAFNEMWLYVCSCSLESASAEKSLIHRVHQLAACCNLGKGGERASKGCPHYLYIVWRPYVMTARR